MGIQIITRNPGWSRLRVVVTWLWYATWALGAVLYVLTLQFAASPDVPVSDNDWSMVMVVTLLIAICPWALMLTVRALRYVIEGFFPAIKNDQRIEPHL